MDGVLLKYVSNFKYLGCVLDESCTDGVEFRRKVSNRGKWQVLSDS